MFRKIKKKFGLALWHRGSAYTRTVVANVVSILDWGGGHNLFCLFSYSFIGAPALNIQTSQK